MKKSTGLLVCSAVAMLVATAVASPTHRHGDNLNLKDIFDKIEDYNHTLNQVWYVDNVRHLTQGHGRCGDKFFCKVENILEKHRNNTQHQQDKELARHVKKFNQLKHTNCTEVLKNTTFTSEIQLPQFLGYLTECIRCRNVNNTARSC